MLNKPDTSQIYIPPKWIYYNMSQHKNSMQFSKYSVQYKFETFEHPTYLPTVTNPY